MKIINCRYDIIEKLGEGTTGSVFLVQDRMYNRVRRALKIIRATGMGSDSAAILRNEFSLLRQFDHPNIVKVYDFGSVVDTDSGLHIDDFFFTLDYVQGKDLFRATEGESDEFIASLVYQIAHALEYIHRRGLIHFDIKPENIIVTEMVIRDEKVHVPKIIDFGFAAPLFGPLSETLKGSLHYIAPELITSKQYDQRVDLYSLGVTLFQILTRTSPAKAGDLVEALKMHQVDVSASLAECRPGTRSELIELVSSLMEKDPRRRLRSARIVVDTAAPLMRQKEIFGNYSVEALPGGLVGRKKELQRLTMVVKEGVTPPDGSAVSDRKKVICIVGEQGVGKTPLLEEWRRQAQSDDILVVGTTCYLKTSPPLEPFRWFLHELRFALLPRGDRARDLLAKYDDLFSALTYDTPEEKIPKFSLDFADEEKKTEFLMMIVRFVHEAVSVVPFVISVDDTNLADEMSIQLLRLLTHSLDSPAPLVVLSCDSIDAVQKELRLELKTAEVIVLSGIDDEGVAEFLQSLLGIAQCPKEVVHAISNRIGDSPYILKEFLSQFRGLSPEAAMDELQKDLNFQTTGREFPRSINEVYDRRFRRLTFEEQYILNVVSCFRIPMHTEVLGKICPYSSGLLSHLLTMLSMSGVLSLSEHGTKVHFSYASFRQFVYQNLGRERKPLQKIIAQTLEDTFRGSSEAESEEIGYHYKEAGVNNKAYTYFVRAAERAATAFSFQESIMLLEESIPLASDDAEVDALLEKLAHQSDLVEDYEKAETLYTELLAKPQRSVSSAYRYRTALGTVQTRRGLLDKAIATFTNALTDAQTPLEILDIEIELADIDITRGRLAEARSRCTKVLENLNEPANDLQRSSLYTKIGIISFYETKYDESSDYFLKAYQILERMGDKTKLIAPLLNLGNAYSVRRQYDKAFESWTNALRYAEDVGNIHQQGQIYNNLGIAEYNQGHYDSALQKYLNGIDIFQRLGNSPGLALCLSNAGEVYVVQSEYEKAFEAWRKCLELHTTNSNAQGIVETHVHLSRLFLTFDETSSAREHLQKSRAILDHASLEAKWPIYYLCLGELALAEKKYDEAEQSFLTAKDAFRTNGDDIRYCEVLLLGGRICRQQGLHLKAAEYFQETVNKGVELRLPLIQAEALMEMGIESRAKDVVFEKKTLVYLKEAFDLMNNESVNDVTWKLCFEIGKEYASRGLDMKSREYFYKAEQSLVYLGSRYTDQSLQKRFWESAHRGAILQEIRSLLVVREG